MRESSLMETNVEAFVHIFQHKIQHTVNKPDSVAGSAGSTSSGMMRKAFHRFGGV
jgi:hypothetical protein